ncbi:hypothetical protein GPECTOR_2g1477 [Gonium pectorale]|uniref:Uncharacterized protein n=1 Tax=Gonium pectorale TaxID=33097 RepID=A0A150H183_GONPE|nr:hypothetical protein GPECTOR_2g1477 [Gonium pectorale]|eukprot:KXZ55926.1 hypothetical protein GPECTOR_2g1477 [Gonium pectorale]
MSQTHGDLSGARPMQEYSACEQSLTHITLGSGPTAHQQFTASQRHEHHQQQQQAYQLQHQQQHQAYASQEQQALQEFLDESTPGPDPGSELLQQKSLQAGRSEGPTGGGGGGTNGAAGAGVFAARVGLGGSGFLGGPVGAGSSRGDAQTASPQDFLFPPQVYDNSTMLREQGNDYDANAGEDGDDRDCGDLDDGGDGNSQGSGKRSRTRRPHLQGRFSGRLTTKEDERRLAEECKLLGPLLGGVGKRGDKSRLTLAKIVRGIATGDVRRFCEERERAIGLLKSKLAAIDPEAAASVPVNSIPVPSSQLAGLGSMPGLGAMGLGGLGGPLGLGPGSGLASGLGLGGGMAGSGGMAPHGHSSAATAAQMAAQSAQLEGLQRENSELQHEVYTLRSELQARERLLLELQDTGIISGFVPTSIPMDDAHRTMSQQTGPMSGAAGGRTHSTDVTPHPQYGLPPRHHSYGHQQYGGPSQMSVPQSASHMSEPGPGAKAMGHAVGGGGGGGPAQQQQPQIAIQPGAGTGGPLGVDGGGVLQLASLPAMSEHSRAGRPLKRHNTGEHGIGGVGGGGAGGAAGGGYGEVPRTMSHPPLGRGGAGGYPHMDLQQQLNSLQAQVEHLQNLQGGGRGPATFLMPMRERAAQPMRMGGGGGGGNVQYGGGGSGNSNLPSPFLPGHMGNQSGLMLLPSHQSESGGNPYPQPSAHGGLGAMHLQQMVKQPSGMYDDVGAGPVGPVGRDPRDVVTAVAGGALAQLASGATRHAGGMGGHGGGGQAAEGLDASLEHIMNTRAMRGEYDLPLELLLAEGGAKGLGGAVGPGQH